MKLSTTNLSILVSTMVTTLLLSATTCVALNSGVVANKPVYDVRSKIYIDGKLVSSPRIMMVANSPAMIFFEDKDKHEKLNIKLIAKNARQHGILLNYDVQYHAGNQHLSSKPQFILLPNKEGKLTLSQNGHALQMVVIANRK